MSKKVVKLSDIAAELGVSITLVSTVLSGKGRQQRISEEQIEKVKKAAKVMGYRYNRFARALRTNRSGLIGIVVADVANNFFGRMARYVENEASKAGYQLIVANFDEQLDKMVNTVETLASIPVDGMIITPISNSRELLDKLKEHDMPFVQIDRFVEGLDADYVVADNFQGGQLLTRLLVERGGYKRIAMFIYNTEDSNYQGRLSGYRSVLSEDGLQEHVFTINHQNFEEDIERAVELAVEQQIEAIFMGNNVIAIQVLRVFKKRSICVGRDIDVVSFDSCEAFEISTPSIPSVEQPLEQMCVMAFGQLLERIKSQNISDTVPVQLLQSKLEVELVDLESV